MEVQAAVAVQLMAQEVRLRAQARRAHRTPLEPVRKTAYREATRIRVRGRRVRAPVRKIRRVPLRREASSWSIFGC